MLTPDPPCALSAQEREPFSLCEAPARKIRRLLCSPLLILLPAALFSGQRAPAPPAELTAVKCAAIFQEQSEDSRMPWGPTSLVVLGRVGRRAERKDAVYAIRDCTVEKVLYGSCPERSIRFLTLEPLEETGPIILVLVPSTAPEADHELKYFLPAAEEKAQLALSAARLDYYVLSAQCIFVGRESSRINSDLRKVEVLRSICGPEIAPGRKVTVRLPSWACIDGAPVRLPAGEMIYLIGRIGPGKRVLPDALLPDTRPELADETLYSEGMWFRVELEPQVRTALVRRRSYPVLNEEDEGRQTQYREVTFQGTVAEAIDLLGSSCEGAATLGARALILDGHARKAVALAAQGDLLRFAAGPAPGFRRLHRLIRLLGEMGQGAADGDVGRLLIDYWSNGTTLRSKQLAP